MPRDRYQQGHLKVMGKRVVVWKGYFYLYRVDGSKKHTSVTLGRRDQMTKAQAQRALQAIIDERTRQPIPMDKYTVEGFATQVWWPIVSSGWERTTRNNNKCNLHKHILPALGAMALNRVDRMTVDRFLAGLELQRASVQRVRATLGGLLSYALDCGAIARNPAHGSIIPGRKDHGTSDTLTLAETRLVLARTTGKIRVVFGLLLGCGLRFGEALALRWDDILPDGLMIDESSDGAKTKCTKTRRPRLVPLSAELRTWLAGMRETAVYRQDRDFIFGTNRNTPFDRGEAHRLWLAEARRDTGIPRLNFQICRRTFATLIKVYGETRDIQGILGHLNPVTTIEHYVQPTSDTQRAAVEQHWKGIVQ